MNTEETKKLIRKKLDDVGHREPGYVSYRLQGHPDIDVTDTMLPAPWLDFYQIEVECDDGQIMVSKQRGVEGWEIYDVQNGDETDCSDVPF